MNTIQKIAAVITAPTVRLTFLILVIGCLFFNQLGANLIKYFDDTYHVAIVSDFAARGDILDIRDNLLGTSYHEKPPFMIVLSALGIKLFGATSFGARFFIALYCALAILLGYILLRRDTDEPLAFTATLIAATTLQILHFSRRVGFDGVLAATLYLAFLFFFFANRHRMYYLLFGAAIGLAAMAKGVSGIIPLAALGLYCLATPDGRARLRDPLLYASILPFLAVVLPWHIGMTLRHGDTFVRTYFWERQLAYFLPAKGPSAVMKMKWDVNLRKIGDTYWPYLPFLIFAVGNTVYRAVRKKQDENTALRWYALVWIAVILGLYQMASIKRYAYVLPVYFGMAVLIAADLRSWRFGRQILIGFAAIAFGIAIVSFTPLWKDVDWSGWESHKPIIEELNKAKTPYTIFPLFKIYEQAVMFYDGYSFHAPYYTNVHSSGLIAFFSNGGRIVMLTPAETNALPLPIQRSMRILVDGKVVTLIERAP